jgi:hypothetical protein
MTSKRTPELVTAASNQTVEHEEPGIGYVNGHFVPLMEAAIPLLDWGFNKSDVVYDGIHERARLWQKFVRSSLPAQE